MKSEFLANISSPRRGRLALAGLFLLILAAKLWLIGQFGNATPFWDQLDGEAGRLLIPYQDGSLSVGQLFAPHNEHRIVFTRLFSLGLVSLNGTWDPKLEMVAQAILHAGIIVLLVGCCARTLPKAFQPALCLFAGLLFMVPYAWEYTLWGFQSQFYFVSLWGILGIWCCWKYPTGSRGWIAGALCLAFGPISMAGGLLAPAAAMLVFGIRLWHRRNEWKRQLIGLVMLLALVAAGFALVQHVTRHDSLKARSLVELGIALLRMTAWPLRPLALAILLQAPFVALVVYACRRRLPAENPAWLLITLGLWIGLQMTAVAYGRAQDCLSSRYTDTFALSLFIGFACLLYLLSVSDIRLSRSRSILFGCWIFTVGFGLLYQAAVHTPPQLENKRLLSRIEESNVKAFLATNDHSHLDGKPLLHIPHPDPIRLGQLLSNPTLRPLLPPSLQPGMTPTQVVNPQQAFQSDGYFPDTPGRPYESVWGSYGPQGDEATGELQLNFPRPNHSRWLKLSVAGYPGYSGMSLTLTDAQGHTQNIAPPEPPRERWRSVFIKAPDGPFVITASDHSPNTWLAVTAPREIGIGTLISGFLQDHALILASLGIALLAIGTIPHRPLDDQGPRS